jgi:hypothetical protein
MGIDVLLGVQSEGWYHMRKDVGASNWSKGNIEVCVLQVKNLMNFSIICIPSFEACYRASFFAFVTLDILEPYMALGNSFLIQKNSITIQLVSIDSNY